MANKPTSRRPDKGKSKTVKPDRTKRKSLKSKQEEARLKHLKKLIERGEYETPEKRDIAIERLIEDLKRYDRQGQLIPGDENGDG